MRKKKKFYDEKYEKALNLYKNGVPIKEIAKNLNISYSAVYFWIKRNRVPEKSRETKMIDYINKNGPLPVAELEEKFPKHNEIYNNSQKIERAMLGKKYKKYNYWYYTNGQEEELKKRMNRFLEKFETMRQKILKILE